MIEPRLIFPPTIGHSTYAAEPNRVNQRLASQLEALRMENKTVHKLYRECLARYDRASFRLALCLIVIAIETAVLGSLLYTFRDELMGAFIS